MAFHCIVLFSLMLYLSRYTRRVSLRIIFSMFYLFKFWGVHKSVLQSRVTINFVSRDIFFFFFFSQNDFSLTISKTLWREL